MENLDYAFIPMIISTWAGYIVWVLLYSGIILAGIIGWNKNKNKGFIFIIVSGCLMLLYHLPSICLKGFYAIRKFTPAEYGEIMNKWSYVDSTIVPLASILLIMGLFFIALKKMDK